MKRYPYSYRHTVYNEGPFYNFVPLARKPVAPGERLSSLTIQGKFISAVFDKANVTPMLAQFWAFYVPNRLVWDQWVDFVALDSAIPLAPTSTTPFPQLYEPTPAPSGGYTVFPRRGMKLAYNQYFGDEANGSTSWYANPLDDTDVTLKRLLAWDQMRAATKATGSYAQLTYVAPVAGASATISLDDFQRSLDASRAHRRQKVTGDKYVDTMRLFGVDLDWKIQLAPEFLGGAQVIIQPREKASSQAQDAAGLNLLYKRASEYQASLTLKTQPKAFSEHGYILTFWGVRPAFMTGTFPLDADTDVPAEFFRPETGNVMETTGRLRERFFAYIKGQNLVGQNLNGNIFTNTALYYPPSTDYIPITGSGPAQMAVGAAVHYRGLSPVRPNVA